MNNWTLAIEQNSTRLWIYSVVRWDTHSFHSVHVVRSLEGLENWKLVNLTKLSFYADGLVGFFARLRGRNFTYWFAFMNIKKRLYFWNRWGWSRVTARWALHVMGVFSCTTWWHRSAWRLTVQHWCIAQYIHTRLNTKENILLFQ